MCNPFEGKRKICRIPGLCLFKEAVVMAKRRLIRPDSPPHHSSIFQKSPFVLCSIRNDFPPFSFRSLFGFCHFNLSFRTSFMSPAVSQSLYPLSPRVASPCRLGHMLFCLAQVSHIPDIISRTPVSLVDSHLDRGGQSLSRQWWTCPQSQVQSTQIKSLCHIRFGLAETIVISCWIR